MTTTKTYFYAFDQNNSGGYYVIDENVTHEIIIEATKKSEAVERLEEILSQKPKYTEYCSCCGKRWYPEYPEVYTRYEVSNERYEDFEYERNGYEAIFYPLEGEPRHIPWLRYGMHGYLPMKDE